jgi:hypothetical protein
MIQLLNIRGIADVDAILLATVAADNVKIARSIKLSALLSWEPRAQQPQPAYFGCILTMMLSVEPANGVKMPLPHGSRARKKHSHQTLLAAHQAREEQCFLCIRIKRS